MNLPAEHHDPRLDYLFVRYWENALTADEGGALDRLLAADAAARDWFRFLTLQAVTAADVGAVLKGTEARTGPDTLPAINPVDATALAGAVPVGRPGGWSRRRVLRTVGAGLAAGVAAGVAGWRAWGGPAESPVRLSSVRGNVRLVSARGVSAALAGGLVPSGVTVHTDDTNSSALLSFPDGSSVSLTGDSALTVADGGRRIVLCRGNADADVRPQEEHAVPLVLATAVATLTTAGGALVSLGHMLRATEVGVQSGSVTVSHPSGEPMGVVGPGEMLTVREDGDRQKQAIPVVPVDFAWDLSQPLPDGWRVGQRDLLPDGPVVRPERWFDPHHKTEMYQIRSNTQWARGFCRLLPESEVRVRYRVDTPGRGQVIFCVRTPKMPQSETGVIEWTGELARGRAGGWQDLVVKAADMRDNSHAPKFGPPWVAFLVIVNTYEMDLGLQIADLRVTRPGRPAPGT